MGCSILITYITAGAGHRRAAEAIAQALQTALPQADVVCRDLLDDVPVWLRRAYPSTYYFLVRHLAGLWAVCFTLLDWPPVYWLVQPIRRAWNLVMARRFIRDLRASPPDLIITTHFFPTDVVSACKRAGWLHAPLVVVVTDFYPHRFWVSTEAEAYVCGTQESAGLLRQRRIRPERLHVLGIPIGSRFHAVLDRGALQVQFGLDPHRRTVLVTSGGSTVGPFEPVVEALLGLDAHAPEQLQLLVVCGDTAAAVRRLQARAHTASMPMHVFGFVDNMPELMAVSDVVVTKAGGLTVSEALGRGLPLILYHVIPGQELLNARYVTERGAAIIARRPNEAARAVRQLLEDPARADAMRKVAAGLSRCDAAETIVSDVVRPLLAARGIA